MDFGWIWLAQIQGTSTIELHPKQPCNDVCSSLESIKLNTGDLRMFNFVNTCFVKKERKFEKYFPNHIRKLPLPSF